MFSSDTSSGSNSNIRIAAAFLGRLLVFLLGNLVAGKVQLVVRGFE
jgi:hypothetical protein